MQKHIPGSFYCLSTTTSSVFRGCTKPSGFFIIADSQQGRRDPRSHGSEVCLPGTGLRHLLLPPGSPWSGSGPQVSLITLPSPWGNILYFDFFHQHFIVFIYKSIIIFKSIFIYLLGCIGSQLQHMGSFIVDTGYSLHCLGSRAQATIVVA